MEKAADERTLQIAELCAELSPDEREAMLDRECGSEADLRRRVELRLNGATAQTNTQVFANDYERALPAHYKLTKLLGRGGMAEVFLAEDSRLGRRVAIKFLNSEFRRHPERMRRFHQEARAASALNHPNILTIHDIGETDGVQFIVSEFVEGETLSSRLRRGRVPVAEAVNLTLQIASALSASHQAGIVHRDVKPDNVMVRRDGSVKVLDFGLAKDSGGTPSDADLDARTLDRVSTSPGLILGTPQYMSPEQARGERLDARTDIFSLGIILFEMITGRPPFQGSSAADTIAAIVSKEPQPLEKYLNDPPVSLIRIVQKALRKDRAERYVSMEHLLSDLRDLRRELGEGDVDMRDTGGTAVRPTLNHTIRTVLEGPIARSARVAALLLGITSAIAGLWYWGRSPSTPIAAPGTMRSIAITSWSSGPREMIASASFNPDGKMIAYAATRSDATEIFVKPVDGGDPVQITKTGSHNQYPVWSPDGREVAFFSSRPDGRGIWRAAFTGGEQVEVTPEVSGDARLLRWAADGKIYFQQGAELFSVDALRQGKPGRHTDFEGERIKPRSIAINAEGSALAYSLLEGGIWKIKVRRLDGSGNDEMAWSAFQIDHIAWRPDGRSVIFSASVDGVYQVFEAEIGREGPVQLSNGGADLFVQDISADGGRILYSSVNETSDLWSIDVETSRESLLANEVASEFWPDISVNGGIVFQSARQVNRPFSGSIIARQDLGSAPVLVSPSGFSPTWSNNGRWIAFFRRTDQGIEVWRSGPSGSGAVRLDAGSINAIGYTPTPYLKLGTHHATWSPADDAVAYAARTENISNIWLAAADGSGRSQISANSDEAANFCCTVFSRDGKRVYFKSDITSRGPGRPASYQLWERETDGIGRAFFTSTEQFRFLGLAADGTGALIAQHTGKPDSSSAPASTGVFLVSLSTGEKRQVVSLEYAYLHNIHLSRDGRSLAFVSRRDNETALWTVPVTGGQPRRLLTENDPKVMLSSLAWSPDGRSIAFGKQTRTSLLSMLAK